MTVITAQMVKELRERTGVGMMECKKALQEADGNMETAIDVLRKAGQAKAAKKAGRTAAEGVIAIAMTDDNKFALMVEVNSETDFAAKDANFKSFVAQVVAAGIAAKAETLEQLLQLNYAEGDERTIAKACEDLVTKIGEKIQLRRAVAIESTTALGSYCHAGRIGVLVRLSKDNVELAKDVAMHIAASKPEVIHPEDLSAEMIEKEKAIFMAQAEQSGKPKEILEKMIMGKINKFVNEISLVGQPFVKDPAVTVGDLLKQAGASVTSFVRFEVGEGIAKEEVDFAAEVEAQVRGNQ
ncbi:MAG: elongation factor Ts [Gammaproteobacteria bacterium]|nr:elongation factor Ts [Gammaproteobacteria bacterium]